MSKFTGFALVLLGGACFACGGGKSDSSGSGGSGASGGSGGTSGTGGSSGSSATGGSSANGGSSGTSASGGSGGSTGGSGGSSAGTSAQGGTSESAGASGDSGENAGTPSVGDTKASITPLISRGVPAFASGVGTDQGPNLSNDDQVQTVWIADKTPCWIAYDLSGASADQRQQVLVAWYAPHESDYIIDPPPQAGELPIDYTIEINGAPGGGSAPSDGWTQVVSVTGNTRSGREHVIQLAGSNWVRMSVTNSSDPASPQFNLDIQSAPKGPTDSWLMVGDSITHLTFPPVWSDLPTLVRTAQPDRWPAILEDGIGGMSTSSALPQMDAFLQDYPGKFVIIALGTNDHANEFQMEALIQKVLAVGKVPVVPHMPWSQGSPEGEAVNALIDALYAKYPEVVPGPDLWKAFENRTDLIPAGDIHPNDAGKEFLRQQWADWMTSQQLE